MASASFKEKAGDARGAEDKRGDRGLGRKETEERRPREDRSVKLKADEPEGGMSVTRAIAPALLFHSKFFLKAI